MPLPTYPILIFEINLSDLLLFCALSFQTDVMMFKENQHMNIENSSTYPTLVQSTNQPTLSRITSYSVLFLSPTDVMFKVDQHMNIEYCSTYPILVQNTKPA